ncbi:hypothetical protein CCH79_00008135, partial [Gambusia affinis]
MDAVRCPELRDHPLTTGPSETAALTAGGSFLSEMFFNFKSGGGRMAHNGVPSVFVVDTHATRPAVPPRLGKQRKQSGAMQTLLFILVTLALLGVFFEAFFIYRLYHAEYAPSGFTSKQINGSPPPDMTDPDGRLHPSKPVAHLTGATSNFATSSNDMFHFSNQDENIFQNSTDTISHGQDVHHGPHVMAWSVIAEPLLYEMKYENKHLIIQKEGYYYIYSKVYFSQGGAFYHSVEMQTKMYAGKGIPLLQAREYSSKKDKEPKSYSNSFLAGVFYLSQNDAICVNVSSTTQIVRHNSYENVFGAYMI